MRTCSKDTQAAFCKCTHSIHTVQTTDAKDRRKHLAAVGTASELYCVSMKTKDIIAINPLESKNSMYYV